MTTTSTSQPSTTYPASWHPPARWGRYSAYTAAGWAVGFGVVNIYLQIAGVDELAASWATATVLNVGVTALKLFGAGIALATVHEWGRRLPTWLLATGMFGAATMLLGYGLLGLGTLITSGALLDTINAGGTFELPALAYTLFFVVGGTAFALAAVDYLRRTGTSRLWLLFGAAGAPVLLGTVLAGASVAFS